MPRGRKKIQPIQASTEIITNEIVPVDSVALESAETAAPAEKTRKKPGRKPAAKKVAAEATAPAEKTKKKSDKKPAAKKEVIAETAASAEKIRKKPGRKPAVKKEAIAETAASAEKIRKKPGRKPAVKKEAIAETAAPAEKIRKKPGRKPGTAASKAKSKKAGKIEEIVFQSSGNNYTMSEIIEKCKDAYRGGTRKRISEIQVYVKSENGIMKAYYVVNGKAGESPVEL